MTGKQLINQIVKHNKNFSWLREGNVLPKNPTLTEVKDSLIAYGYGPVFETYMNRLELEKSLKNKLAC